MIQNHFMVTKEGNEGKQLVRRKMKLFFCILNMLGMIRASKEGKLSLPTIVFFYHGNPPQWRSIYSNLLQGKYLTPIKY